jgi:hypothetical protein
VLRAGICLALSLGLTNEAENAVSAAIAVIVPGWNVACKHRNVALKNRGKLPLCAAQ